jgi:hypothetical protein
MRISDRFQNGTRERKSENFWTFLVGKLFLDEARIDEKTI